jgi:hypothetical protein
MPRLALRLLFERKCAFQNNGKDKLGKTFIKKTQKFLSQYDRKVLMKYKDYFIPNTEEILVPPYLKYLFYKAKHPELTHYYILGFKITKIDKFAKLHAHIGYTHNDLRQENQQLKDLCRENQQLKEALRYAEKRIQQTLADLPHVLRNFQLAQAYHGETFEGYRGKYYGRDIVLAASGPSVKYEKKYKMLKIVCYGAGTVFEHTKKRFDTQRIKIVAVLDKNAGEPYAISGRKGVTVSPESIQNIAFDYVLICSVKYAWEMIQNTLSYGVNTAKIVVCCENPSDYPTKTSSIRDKFDEYNNNRDILSRLFVDGVSSYYIVRGTMAEKRELFPQSFASNAKYDYVRYSTLNLISQTIRQSDVDGDVAELGVYRGDFASYINECFPQKKLYLFDTFEGFDLRDFNYDTENHYLNQERLSLDFGYLPPENLKETSVDFVLSRMPFKDNVIVKQGYFPETAKDIDEHIKFAFVSIDADLYLPTYEGLKFFYSRLNKGGYIMVHDYGDSIFAVKKAVDDFYEETGIVFVPLCDVAGSIVIVKS